MRALLLVSTAVAVLAYLYSYHATAIMLTVYYRYVIPHGSQLEQPDATYGPSPVLPEPEAPGRMPLPPGHHIRVRENRSFVPRAPPGFVVSKVVDHGVLDNPRNMLVLSNGDILVSEARTPAEYSSMEKFIGLWFMSMSNNAGESANRVSLLRNGTRHTLVEGVYLPFGLAVVDEHLYVAASDEVVRYPFRVGDLTVGGPGERVCGLPSETEYNHHWTRNLMPSDRPGELLVTVGSTSNIGEKGPERDHFRGAVLRLQLSSGELRLECAGLRNPVGLDRCPESGHIWTAVNERDGLGDNLCPDYITPVVSGGDYGWPTHYWGVRDTRVTNWPEPSAPLLQPAFALGAHTASLGLLFTGPLEWPAPYGRGALVAQHGSWNRRTLSGYRVVWLPFDSSGEPSGQQESFLEGWVEDARAGLAWGRPTMLVRAGRCALLSDDSANMIWRICPADKTTVGQ